MPNSLWVDPKRYYGQAQTLGSDAIWNDKRMEKLYNHDAPDKTKLKKMVRLGIPDQMRGRVYAKILKVGKLSEYETNYDAALRRIYGKSIPDDPLPPTFGGRFHKNQLALTKEGVTAMEHILCILQHDFPNLEYSPMLPPLLALLSHHMESPNELLGAIVSIVKRSMNRDNLGVSAPAAPNPAHSSSKTRRPSSTTARSGDRWTYIATYRKDTMLLARAFGNFFHRTNRKLHSHITALQEKLPEPIWMTWICDLFIGVLPQAMVWRVLDLFVVEGYKALFRVGIALFLLRKDQLMQQTSIEAVIDLLTPTTSTMFVCTIDDLMKQANSISCSRADVRKLQNHHWSLAAISKSDELPTMQYQYQRGKPKLQHDSKIIKEDVYWIAIWSWVPHKLRMSELELIFTTKEHGHHILTFYEKTKARKPLLLVLETVEGAVFGAYLSTQFPESDDWNKFVGNGETFLFSLAPYAKLYPWVGCALQEMDDYEDESDGESDELLSPSPITPTSAASFTSSVGMRSPLSVDGSFVSSTCSTPNSGISGVPSIEVSAKESGIIDRQSINSDLSKIGGSPNGTTTERPKPPLLIVESDTGSTSVPPSPLKKKPSRMEKENFVQEKASFFLRCSRKDIAIGGGGSDIGIWLDESLTKGTTGPCLTFENDALTGDKSKKFFEILTMEVFAFT